LNRPLWAREDALSAPDAPIGLNQGSFTHGDGTLGALQNKRDKSLFINFATHVTPACDCYGHSDAPIVQDVGIFASTDPVALDQACVDRVNAQRGLADTALTSNLEPGQDKFRGIYPRIDWSAQLRHGERLGLGSTRYRFTDIGATKV